MSATVFCIKGDGSRLEFKTYDDAREAKVIAARLREVGCNATVEPCEARELGGDANVVASSKLDVQTRA